MTKDSTIDYQPMYARVKNSIVGKIQSGEYKTDSKLPTESELCEEYGVSKAPVRQALTMLENERYIYKVQGKGSFVLSGYIKQRADRLQSFTDEIIEMGHKPGAKFVSQNIIKADAEIAANLRIAEGEQVLSVIRLRYIDDEIYSLNYSFYPIERFPKLEEVDFHAMSVTVELAEKMHAQMREGTILLEATSTTAEMAGYLERAVGTPILQMDRTTYYQVGRVELPMDFSRVYFVPEKYRFEITLKK